MTRTESRLAARMAAALRVYEKNDCHNPPGTPNGGQFCGTGGKAWPAPSETMSFRDAQTGRGAGSGLLDSGGMRNQAHGQFVDGKWVDDVRPPMTVAAAAKNAEQQAAIAAIGTPEALVERLVAQAKEGREALDDPEVRASFTDMELRGMEKGRGWYWTVHGQTKRLARASGFSHDQVVGVFAVMSSQTNWADSNVPNARRALRVMKDNKPYAFTADDLARVAATPFGKGPRGKDVVARLQQYVGQTVRPRDKGLPSELVWAHPDFPHSIPGGAGGILLTIKAARILNGEPVDSVVGGIKTRSFYNNIRHPAFRGSTTLDIHAVRAVYNDFSISQGDPRYTAVLGSERTYAVAASAVAEAARRLGMRPHELQAELWVFDKTVSTRKGLKSGGLTRTGAIAKRKAGKHGTKESAATGGRADRRYALGRLLEALRRDAPHGGRDGRLTAARGASHEVASRAGGGAGRPTGPGDLLGMADLGRVGSRLLEQGRASGGTATSRQGKLVAPSTAPVTGPRASRRNFIRKVATILSKPPKAARLPRAAAPTAAKAPTGLLKPKRAG